MAKKTKKNSSVPILILAILIVLAIVGYFGYKNIYTKPSTSQAMIDTTSWKKYTNTQYNYFLLYPADWKVEILNNGEVFYINKNTDPIIPSFSVELFNTPPTAINGVINYDSWIRRSLGDDTYAISNMGEKSVNGLTMKSFGRLFHQNGLVTDQSIYIFNNSLTQHTYALVLNDYDSRNAADTLSKMLLTFKFTK